MTFKSHLQLLTEAFEPLLEGDEEKQTFLVRKGVVFDGYEVFLYHRMVVIPPVRFKHSLDNGELSKLAQGIIEHLRRNHPIVANEPSYTVRDLEVELIHAYTEILEKALGKDKANEVYHTCTDLGFKPFARIRNTRLKLAQKIVDLLKDKPKKEAK